MIILKVTKEFGRGLYASTSVLKGIRVMLCELLVLSKADTINVNKTDLKHYTFKFNNECDCLVLGVGEIFNHSDHPNVAYNLVRVNGRTCMIFNALRHVRQGEQLFIDYDADIQVNTNSYVNSKSMIG